MGQMLRDLLSSKKFFVAMATVIAWIAARIGWHVDPTQLTEAMAPLISYVVAQGVADHGKTAAQLNLQSAQIAAQIAAPIPAPKPYTTIP